MLTEPGPRPSFAPRNWPGWIMVGLLWLLGQVPAPLGRALAHPLGGLMRVLMGRRRKVVERNLERCFPELDTAERRQLTRETFVSLARAVFETAWSWAASPSRIDRMSQLEGIENMAAAQRQGKGVLCVSCHSTSLEIGGFIIGTGMKRRGWFAAGIYRPLDNPVIEWFQNRCRFRFASGMISKRDLRGAIRQLREGNIVWYAPDQDFGPKQSAFSPFFGIQTASLVATHKMARLTSCAVVPMFPWWDAAIKRYRVQILPALENFPSDDEAADLARINQLTENFIRTVPGQYWWVHRRFKTRPEGEPDFYA